MVKKKFYSLRDAKSVYCSYGHQTFRSNQEIWHYQIKFLTLEKLNEQLKCANSM
jgi:hypothetical protein